MDSVEIIRVVKENAASLTEWEKAKNLDAKFMKQSLREDFHIPKSKKEELHSSIANQNY